MIDHVLGRPSTQFRKVQVFGAVAFWSLYLWRGDRHGPPILRDISARLSKKMTSWQSLVITLLFLYLARNFAKITGLESPEPLANLYSRSYFRATWVTTALDAGFWTAMRIRNKRLRDFASIVFSAYYLIAAEQADEKVRKVRATLTVDHMRVAWNKPSTPYLFFFTSLLRPRFMRYGPRALRIPRPATSGYTEPINAYIYFDGSLSQLRKQKNVVLDIPGGGFVAMDPRCHEDKLLAWAGKTGLPVVSLDYRKAPEYPYPHALNECYDAYHSIVATKGQCIGLQGDISPRIVLTGDSAGGNLATGVTLMIIQSVGSGSQRDHVDLPVPAGLVLIYPALDMNIGSWMTDDQMALIRNPRTVKRQENYVRRKSEDIDNKWTPSTPRPSETDTNVFEEMLKTHPIEPESPMLSPDVNVTAQKTRIAVGKPQSLKTRLAVSSLISYFGDRIITPEMMRAMIILYVGPYARPDFTTDHFLSPAVAPEALLARFPKTYFLTGERDPLVDDTVIFAGRLRQAKLHLFRERKDLGLEKSSAEFDEKNHVEIALIPGISHGFLQFVSVFPEGWKHIFRCGRWIEEIFRTEPTAFEMPTSASALMNGTFGGLAGSGGNRGLAMNGQPPPQPQQQRRRHHRRILTGDSSADEDRPLEMTSVAAAAAATTTTTTKSSLSPPAIKSERTPGRRNFERDERRQEREREREREESPELERSKSTTSLASEDGLLKRRMNGLTIGLMGGTDTEH